MQHTPGQTVALQVDRQQPATYPTAAGDGRDAPGRADSGACLLRMRTGRTTRVRKVPLAN